MMVKGWSRNLAHLGYLEPNGGSTKSYKRLGRGASSGKGKTSGRGQKGQKARGKVPHWMEGGQTPYFKQLPMIGSTKEYVPVFHEVYLSKIQDFWKTKRIPLEEGDTLTIKVMRECGIITGSLKDGVMLIGTGGAGQDEYNVPLNVEASKATEAAIAAIESTNHSFTARYFTTLGLRAHVNPEKFLLKYGYVPLQARPTDKKSIAYYSDPEQRGYLHKDPSILTEALQAAREQLKVPKPKKSKSKFKSLSEQLMEASSVAFAETSKTVKISELV
ncbi:mitochondrial 54S ribosomal protein uL15m [Lodderomyces beijingensis]|uniref:Large ribosomal subunit protein uL15/eL18 domain-containing protein n=1 Tax=Lodderomyces beijingensis TaxID=1775926 RepID=A0ABP0ZCM9_9ASCO